jgi:hypothetical protein
VGLVGLLALFAQAIVSVNFSQESMIAKQKAREALESVFTARNTQQITWDQIRNVGGATAGIFLVGFQPMYGPGLDASQGPPGLIGTANHGNIESIIVDAGPDQTPGTSDDTLLPLSNFKRQIAITDYATNPDMRSITVTIRYSVRAGLTRDFQVSSVISRFR